MKINHIIFLLCFIACSNFAESTATSMEQVCRFDFTTQADCVYNGMRVSVRTAPFAKDEIKLSSLEVTYRGTKQSLKISEDTTLIPGDQGIISFEDINFDGMPDIAVSTSFGVANLYMDYWIFDHHKNIFLPIGNHCRFTLDPVNKILKNTVKINAATYQSNVYSWHGSKLVKKD